MEDQIQNEVPVPQQTPTPVPPSESGKSIFKSKLFLGFVIIATLSAFLIGGYFLGKSSNKTSGDVTISPTPISEPTSTPAQKPDENASWKTYTNSQFGFNFKYPTNWKTAVVNRNYIDLHLGLIPSDKVQGDTSNPIYLERYSNPDNLSFQDWDKKQNEGKPSQQSVLNHTDTRSENINGYTAYVNDKANCEPVFCEQVIIMGNKNIIVFTRPDFTNIGYTKEEIDSYKPIFDQILSTFKFTDSAEEVYPVGSGVYSSTYSSEGQNCGPGAGPAGNAKCEAGLVCKNIDSEGIGTCIKQ